MIVNAKKNNERILIVAGCSLEFTPVVRAYLEYLESNLVEYEVIEFILNSRLKFLFSSLSKVFSRINFSKIIFVNFQALPVLLFSAFSNKSELIYWKLESYNAFENWSLVLKLQLIEWLIPRSKVALVLPNSQRKEVQCPNFRRVYVLPNAPFRPYFKGHKQTSKRTLNSPSKLLIYGQASMEDPIYVREWAGYCNDSANHELNVFGRLEKSTKNVIYHGRVGHKVLLNVMLNGDYDYNLVGYRILSSNTHLAAPNKLIESLACGLPVIGNLRNPFVVEIIEKYHCGICIDFENIKNQKINFSEEEVALHKSNAIKAANELCLDAQIKFTPMAVGI